MAPECLDKVAADTTPAIDVWAIGIMFYAMIYGTLPFFSNSEKDLVKMIRTDHVKFPNDRPVTPEGKEIIRAMLNKDPSKRLELIDLIQQDYAIMDDEEFEALHNKAVQQFEADRQKAHEVEEQKLQEKFMAQLDMKANEHT